MGGNLIRREETGHREWIFLCLQEISRWYTRTKKGYHYHHGTPFFPHVVFNDTVNGSLYIIMIVAIIIFWIVSWPVSFSQETTSSVIQALTSFKFWLSIATLPEVNKLLSMGGNSSAIVLPVAGKPTEIARETLVYNDYFHLHVFCFS